MVKAAKGTEAQLAALIRSQRRDAANRHSRRAGVVMTETDLSGEDGLDFALDRMPARNSCSLIPIEGRTHEWGQPVRPVCPTCKGRCGDRPCLRCDKGAERFSLRGYVNPDAGNGPTSWEGTGELKGGKGR